MYLKNYFILFYFIVSFNSAFSVLIDNFTDYEKETHAFAKGTDLIGALRTQDINLSPSSPENNRSKTDISFMYDMQHNNTLRFNDISTFIFHTSSNPHLEQLTCDIKFSDTFNNIRSLEGISLGTDKDIKIVPITEYKDLLIDENKPFLDDQIIFMSLDYKAVSKEGESGGMYLEEIEAVPEPFSILTLGSGVLNFIQKRKKKLSKVIS